MPRRFTFLAALLTVVAACGSSAAHDTAPTTTTTTTTSTTAAPTTTTTSLPRFPPAPTSGDVKALVTRTGVVVPVLGRAGTKWQVETPCSATAVVSGGTPLYGATVVLDPGHGGKETGAVGPNGLVERDLNLVVAKLTKADLEREGATVVLTRDRDYEMTLQDRADIARHLAPLAFVSIHHNGGADGPAAKPGTETYYQHTSSTSKRLAGLLYEDVERTFAGRPGIAWFANVDAGAKYRIGQSGDDYYGILRLAHGVPTAISEGLFLSASRAEADLLARPDVQAAEAQAIAHAIQRDRKSVV